MFIFLHVLFRGFFACFAIKIFLATHSIKNASRRGLRGDWLSIHLSDVEGPLSSIIVGRSYHSRPFSAGVSDRGQPDGMGVGGYRYVFPI